MIEKTSHNEKGLVRFTVQDCTFRLGVLAVSQSHGHDSWEAYRPVLEESLPFNSRETRRRYTSQLYKWALENGNLCSLGARVWNAYQDKELADQLLRERYLAAYPVLGRFVTQVLRNTKPGKPLPREVFEEYLMSEQATWATKTVKRLWFTMRDLGFLRKVDIKTPVVNATTLPRTAFLILLHHHFAPAPSTVAVQEILTHSFWRYLGGRDESEVRSALSLAAANDLIDRYATVDHLEQVTTRYSLDEFLRRQLRLDT